MKFLFWNKLFIQCLIVIVISSILPVQAMELTSKIDDETKSTIAKKPQTLIVGKSKQKIIEILKQTPYFVDFATFYKLNIKQFENVTYGNGYQKYRQGVTLINIEQMDCVTFVENFIALALVRKEMSSNPSKFLNESEIFNTFIEKLNSIRYYNGQNNKWEDRINYFTAALQQLKSYGLVKNVGEINGVRCNKKICYMSNNRQRFPGIGNWANVKKIEQELTLLKPHYYPLNKIEDYRLVAENGDIVALATTAPGLDVSHCGFIDIKDGKLHFTHASFLKRKVVLQQNLLEYLQQRKNINGIFVYRPIF